MDNKFLINIEIAGKKYGLTIDRSEEEDFRMAEKQLRSKMNQYRTVFNHPDISEKDILAMVALQISLSNLRLEKQNDTSSFIKKIEQLTADLEKEIDDKI